MLDIEKIKNDRVVDFRSMHLLEIATKEERWGGFTFAQLDGAFNTIKNKDDWKAPIDVIVSSPPAVDIVVASIEYYTSTKPKISNMVNNGRVTYRIISEGYRMGPAGDH